MTRNLEIVPNDRKSTKYPSNIHEIGPEVASVLHSAQLGCLYLSFPLPFQRDVSDGRNIRLGISISNLSAGPIWLLQFLD